LPLLSVAREKGVFVRSLTGDDDNHNAIPEDLSNYKVARAGNLVINKMKAWQGSMGIAPCDGIVSPAYYVFSFKVSNAKYGQALLRSRPYVSHFGQASDGVRVGQWDLSIVGMRQIPILIPPHEEQSAIVKFLDWANGRIDRAIRAKRKVIALLNEQKQAIIHRAVTRGIDPNVELKPSGVPWLGEIPKHWEVQKVKRYFKTSSGATPNTSLQGRYYGGRIPWIRTLDLNNNTVATFEIGITEEALNETACKIFPKNTVLIAMYGGGGTIGKNGMLGFEAATNQAICALLPSPRFDSKFVQLFFQFWRPYWMIGADGTRKDPNISQDRIRESPILAPPLSEQELIVKTVFRAIAPLDESIRIFERELALLREYHERLVADVVTGKMNVVPVAANLSIETEASLPESDVMEHDDIEEDAELTKEQE
jgi:type I restriction enzyme S subunit